MSATGRGAVREPDDFYTSPSWTVRRLFEAWRPAGGIWLEPSAGNGAIIRSVDAIPDLPAHKWIGIELREEEAPALRGLCFAIGIGDFLGMSPRELGANEVTAVLGNPPYSKAEEFVHQARTLCPRAEIAFLLRLNFAGSETRQPFLQASTPDVYVLPNRPSFTGGPTDSIEYAWFLFRPDRDRPAKFSILNLTPLEERQRDRGHVVMPEAPPPPAQRELFG